MKRIVLTLLVLMTLLMGVVALAESRIVPVGGYTVTGITLDNAPATNTFSNPNASNLGIGIRAWSGGVLQTSNFNSCSGSCDHANGAQLSPILPPVYYTSRHTHPLTTFYTSVGGGQSSQTCWDGGC